MPSLKHLHTYVRSRANKRTFKCGDPDCSHFSTIDVIEGKSAKCPFCGEKYTLSMEELSLKMPKCEKCKKRRVKTTDVQKIYNSLDALFEPEVPLTVPVRDNEVDMVEESGKNDDPYKF